MISKDQLEAQNSANTGSAATTAASSTSTGSAATTAASTNTAASNTTSSVTGDPIIQVTSSGALIDSSGGFMGVAVFAAPSTSSTNTASSTASTTSTASTASTAAPASSMPPDINQLFKDLLPLFHATRTAHLAAERKSMQDATAEQLTETGIHYLEEHGDANTAMQYFNDAIAKKPDLLSARLQRGKIFLHNRQHVRALDDFNAVLEREPTNVDALIKRSACYIKTATPADILADCEKIISLAPNSVDGYCGRIGAQLEKCKIPQPIDIKMLEEDCNAVLRIGGAPLDNFLAQVVKENLEKLRTQPSAALVDTIYKELGERFNALNNGGFKIKSGSAAPKK